MVISIAFCDFALWNFAAKNEAFSATEQNLTYNNSFFLEDRVQFSSISSTKAASVSPTNYYSNAITAPSYFSSMNFLMSSDLRTFTNALIASLS